MFAPPLASPRPPPPSGTRAAATVWAPLRASHPLSLSLYLYTIQYRLRGTVHSPSLPSSTSFSFPFPAVLSSPFEGCNTMRRWSRGEGWWPGHQRGPPFPPQRGSVNGPRSLTSPPPNTPPPLPLVVLSLPSVCCSSSRGSRSHIECSAVRAVKGSAYRCVCLSVCLSLTLCITFSLSFPLRKALRACVVVVTPHT